MSNVSIYDEDGHLVPYDNGLVEEGQFLYFSGILNKGGAETSSEGVFVERAGPIVDWYRPTWRLSLSDPEVVSRDLVLTTVVDGVQVIYTINSPLDFSVEYVNAVKKYELAPVAYCHSDDGSDSDYDQSEDDYDYKPNKKPKSSKSFSKIPSTSSVNTSPSDLKVLLESLGGHSGLGQERLSHLLPDFPESSDVVAAFLLFICERQV